VLEIVTCGGEEFKANSLACINSKDTQTNDGDFYFRLNIINSRDIKRKVYIKTSP
jgi:hypothetical protein